MGRYHMKLTDGERIFIGVDVHKKSWHVTVMTAEVELSNGCVPGRWDSLRLLLERYRGHPVQVVYEAGFSGFWLYDEVVAYGADCIVTPPSLVPGEYGNRVKTDRRDSRKLASLLSKGLLKRVWVPDGEGRSHRQVARRRRQLIRDRVRTQHRIKSELAFYGVDLPAPSGKWTKVYVRNLRSLRFSDRWLRESFNRLLDEYDFLSGLIDRQTALLKELSETERYRGKVALLRSMPGVGLITAMEILLELGDVSRFGRADHLAAYVGLTPSQYSSGETVRMGRITGIGKSALRSTLVEAAWRMIGKSEQMRDKYESIKARAGSKRAIVAVARVMLLKARRMLLDNFVYVEGLAA